MTYSISQMLSVYYCIARFNSVNKQFGKLAQSVRLKVAKVSSPERSPRSALIDKEPDLGFDEVQDLIRLTQEHIKVSHFVHRYNNLFHFPILLMGAVIMPLVYFYLYTSIFEVYGVIEVLHNIVSGFFLMSAFYMSALLMAYVHHSVRDLIR